MSKRKLLLADDSVTIQKVVNLTFADEGIEVITVGDGDAAMQKFAEVSPDLVMADVNMPGLDGYRVCEKIKQDTKTKQTPVILLVGSFEPFDEEKARQVGANDFLTKPFQSIRQLVNKVSDLLNSKSENNSLSENESAVAPVNSSDDTLKIKPIEESNAVNDSSEDLGDAGMDDEMIQSSRTSIFGDVREPEIESQPTYQSFAEDLDRTSLKQPYNSEKSFGYVTEKDSGKTQPLSKEDIYEIEANLSEQETASALNLNDADLLEFPKIKDEGIFAESLLLDDSEIDVGAPDTIKDEKDKSSNVKMENAFSPDSVKNSLQSENFSSELIEAIADKVVEKLSNKVIKRIVREVLAQTEKRK